MTQIPLPFIQVGDIVIRFLEPYEAPKMLRYRLENRDFLQAWEPLRRPEFYSEPYWELQLKTSIQEFRQGQSLSLVILNQDQEEVLGVCNISNIVRGTFQSCHLGYSIAERHQGKGHMRQALEPVCDYVFVNMGMHRIMANYMSHNERSGRLLESLGFTREGFAEAYLLINGRWEDHVLTSLINPRHRAQATRASIDPS